MSKKIYANVHVHDGPDGPKYFEYGDEVPDSYAERIGAPVWDEPEPSDPAYRELSEVQDPAKAELQALRLRTEELERQLVEAKNEKPKGKQKSKSDGDEDLSKLSHDELIERVKARGMQPNGSETDEELVGLIQLYDEQSK